MLTGRDMVLIASVDWEPLWQSHQEIATRFAAAGNRVLYIENTGVRAPVLADSARVASRVRRWRSGRRRGLPIEVRPNLFVYSPIVLPPFGSRLARRLNRAVFLKAINRTARRLGFRDPVVWTWLPTDTALDIAESFRTPEGALIYFCIADFEQLTPKPARLRRTEIELLRRADLVLAHSPATKARSDPFATRVRVLPPSVDLSLFPLGPTPAHVPEQPVIGYVGGVHAIVDLELVAACARLRPRWRWVLAGPPQRSTEAVDALPNVELLGPVAHADLPSIVAGFDVGVVPYCNTDETSTVAPTKVNEYLAVGRPVVATDLPWIVDFQHRHSVLQVTAAEPAAFVAGIELALAESTDPDAALRRRAVAGLSDWSARLEWLSRLIAGDDDAASDR